MSITAERKQEVLKEFAKAANDTGSPEVQIALLTERIKNAARTCRLAAEASSAIVGIGGMSTAINSASLPPRIKSRTASACSIESRIDSCPSTSRIANISSARFRSRNRTGRCMASRMKPIHNNRSPSIGSKIGVSN